MGKRTPEQQSIDEGDDHARLVAANRNKNNLSFRDWMKLHLLHLVFWTVTIGITIWLVA